MNLGVEKFKINYKSREFWKNSFARVSPGGFTRHLKRFTRSKSKSKPYIINDDEATKKKLRKEKENNKDILYKTHDLIAQSHSTQKISPLTQKNTNISQDMILQPKDSNKNVPATQREVGKQNLPPKPPVGGKLNDVTSDSENRPPSLCLRGRRAIITTMAHRINSEEVIPKVLALWITLKL